MFLCAMSVKSIKAQCTPDPNLKTPDIMPKELVSGSKNVAYNQIIYFYINKDTTVAVLGTNQKATIDSLYISYVLGMPKGLSYTCNNSVCGIQGDQGGCAKISGTPSESGFFPIIVITTVKATVTIPFIGNVKQTIVDTNSHYSIMISNQSGIAELRYTESAQVYPNPNKENNHLLYFANTNGDTRIHIIDRCGNEVYNVIHSSSRGMNHTELQSNSFSAGLYFILIEHPDGKVEKLKLVKD